MCTFTVFVEQRKCNFPLVELVLASDELLCCRYLLCFRHLPLSLPDELRLDDADVDP